MAKKEKKEPSKFINWWNNFFEKFFYIPPILSAISALWFPLVVVQLGKHLNIIDDNKDFTIKGIVASIIVFLIPAVLTIIKSIVERYKSKTISVVKEELEDERNFSDLLLTIASGFSKLCDKKRNHIANAIAHNKVKSSAYNCREQLELILEQLDQSASYMLSQKNSRLRQNDLYVSLYYQFYGDETWHCVNTCQDGMTTEDLLEKDTTFKYLLNDTTPNYVFYNSKEEAKGEHHYAKDSLDETRDNELSGSIIGYRFPLITDDVKYIDAMIFLTTYSKKVVSSNDKDQIEIIKNNLQEFVLKQFSKRISIELGLWYLEKNN